MGEAAVLTALDALEDMAAQCQAWAVERFDTFGGRDARGAALWDVAAFIREKRIPHLRLALMLAPEVQYGVSYCDGEEVDGAMPREDAEHLIRTAREQIAADETVAEDYEPMALVERDYWPPRWSEWRTAAEPPPAGGEVGEREGGE